MIAMAMELTIAAFGIGANQCVLTVSNVLISTNFPMPIWRALVDV
jgi:hypothetical protein